MLELQIKGTQEFMGKEIPVVEGGFGEGKRCLTDKTIAEIHNMRNSDIRRRIKDNVKRFKIDIDIIDLKRSDMVTTLLNLGYAKQSITQAEHIYLLSERGYSKLASISQVNDELYDSIMKKYFNNKSFVYSNYTRKELEFIDQLEQTLEPFNIKGIRQYSVLNYKIDYYIPSLNIAIEYDENGHKNYTYEQHELRQLRIEKELGCKFIRATDDNTHSYNVGLILKQLFEMNILKEVM